MPNLENDFEFNKNILLTGAGFTKNFGGFLREEMWTSIFNNKVLQSCPPLRNHLVDSLDSGDFDYERVYQNLLDDPNSKDIIRDLFSYVLFESYKKMDGVIMNWFPKFNGISGYHETLLGFLSKFSGSEQAKGAFFTLNQDVFIERHFLGTLEYPGKAAPCLMGDLSKSRKELNAEWVYPEKFQNHPKCNEALENLSRCKFMYVKLHGSFNWRDGNGRPIIIAGGKKSQQIKKYPFLDWYHTLFRKALLQDSAKLLIIGYGFQDEHINSVIEEAVWNYDLKVYVISPESLGQLSYRLRNRYLPVFKAIKHALAGYFQETLTEIFPLDFKSTVTSKILEESFFSTN